MLTVTDFIEILQKYYISPDVSLNFDSVFSK